MTSPLHGISFGPAASQSTPAREKATKGQVRSHQGAYVFKVDRMELARRFLILGSEGSFYQTGTKMSLENAQNIRKLAKSDRAIELIDLITDVSVHGRAPKQSPGLFALAVVISQSEDQEVKNYAYKKLGDICRTASTLFEFIGYLHQFQGSAGMGLQKAIGRWYMEKDLDKLAYQMVKYRQRNGMDHSRTLRLSKRVQSKVRPEIAPLLNWSLGYPADFDSLPRPVKGYEMAKRITNGKDMALVIREYGLTWEMIPTEFLNNTKVWEALLDGNVPMTALIRSLPRLTNLGMIQDLGGITADIERRLTDPEALRKARIHPMNALVAMRTYHSGHGESSTWKPVHRISAALEGTFYASFPYVEPTGKSIYEAVDVSGSMNTYWVPKMPLRVSEAAAVMAMVVARTEPEHFIRGFQTQMVDMGITKNDSLLDVMRKTQQYPFAGTNLSLPMLDALERGLHVDAFVMYTDNENGLGRVHPFQALDRYRRETGIPAKIVVNAMTATRFSMADPKDELALDIAGFDSSAPSLIAEFIK